MSKKLKVALAVAGGLVILAGGALGYATTLPDTWRVERSRVIAAPPGDVFPLVVTLSRWPEWSAFTEQDGRPVPLDFSGPPSGVGATMAWRTPEPPGRLVVTACEPDRELRFEIAFEGLDRPLLARLALEPVEGGTRVTWTDDGVLPGLVFRLLRPLLEGAVAEAMDTSLARLEERVRARAGR